MMSVDNWLRNLLFTEFRIGKIRFEFLEGLLAVCITGVGLLLRTSFDTGLPGWVTLLVEWYLAIAAGTFVWHCTKSRKRALGAYALLFILPTVIAEGTILQGDAGTGTLLFLCTLLFLQFEMAGNWLFTLAAAALLLLHVRYIGILFACMMLWQWRKLKSEQLLILLAAGAVRFTYSYRLWLGAGYTLDTFHWPNVYEIVGKEVVQGQLIDPAALVGVFLTLGLLIMAVWIFSQGQKMVRTEAEDRVVLLRLFLFFLMAAGYFLPYMDQSYGYLLCVVSVLYFLLIPREFPVPMLLQIVTYAGYQDCLNGESMMPMAVFALIQFLVMGWLGIQLLNDAGVLKLCRKN